MATYIGQQSLNFPLHFYPWLHSERLSAVASTHESALTPRCDELKASESWLLETGGYTWLFTVNKSTSNFPVLPPTYFFSLFFPFQLVSLSLLAHQLLVKYSTEWINFTALAGYLLLFTLVVCSFLFNNSLWLIKNLIWSDFNHTSLLKSTVNPSWVNEELQILVQSIYFAWDILMEKTPSE